MAAPEWVRLFDTGEMDHVVGLVARAEQGVASAMNDVLIPLVDDYFWYWHDDPRISEGVVDIAAAGSLREVALHIADEFESRRDIDPQSLARRLRSQWLEFIAAGAGYLLYDKMPREKDDRRKGSIARGKRIEAVRKKAISQFDPGKHLSDSRRAEIILASARKAQSEKKFPDADLLPSADRLRKYLRRTS